MSSPALTPRAGVGARAFVTQHAVLTYCVLTFAISWGGLLLVHGPGGLTSSTWRSGPVALIGIALLAGPSVAGLLLIGLTEGRGGYSRLLERLAAWRVGGRWYAVALCTAPLLSAATLFALTLVSPDYLPVVVTTEDRLGLIATGLGLGLVIGFFEELGWSGFAVPRLRARHDVLATGLIVGGVWSAWHLLPNIDTDSFTAGLPFVLLIVRVFAWLPAYRLLMVWVYEHTASVLLMVLMHASLVAATTVVFIPRAPTHEQVLVWLFVWSAVLWLLAAAVTPRTRIPRRVATDRPEWSTRSAS